MLIVKVNTTKVCIINSDVDIDTSDVLDIIELLIKYIKKHAKNKVKNKCILTVDKSKD